MPKGVKLCPKCGQSNGPAARACKHCGVDMPKKGNAVKIREYVQKTVQEAVKASPASVTPVYDNVLASRVRTLETKLDAVNAENRQLAEIVRELLKISKAFHDIPKDLMLKFDSGKWFARTVDGPTIEVSSVIGSDAHVEYAAKRDGVEVIQDEPALSQIVEDSPAWDEPAWSEPSFDSVSIVA